MASFLTWLGRLGSFLTQFGRFAFFGLIITQCCFLSAYLAKYEGTSNWYLMVFSFGPAVFVWFFFLLFDALYLGCLFQIWGLYIVALVVNIAMVFGKVGDRIDKTEFLGPNALKMVLCITPLLLLLLLNTGDLDDSDENEEEREIVSKLCFPMAVDLFDGIEMIDIVLEEREHDFGIPKHSVQQWSCWLASACWYHSGKWQKTNSPKRGGTFVSVALHTAILFK